MADIIFTGNLGANSELRFTPSGSAVLNFRAADSKSKKNDSGGWDKVTEQWFNVTLWGSMAEFMVDKLQSGVRVKVYGEFYQRAYEGKNGPGISLDVKASAVEVLTSKQNRPPGDSPNASYGNQQQAQQQGNWGGQQQSAPPADPWATPQQYEPNGSPPF